MTSMGQREQAGSKQQGEGTHRPEDIRSTKKRRGRGLYHLIPVSRPYLRGIGLSEAPTICSTCVTAAFLVLKP